MKARGAHRAGVLIIGVEPGDPRTVAGHRQKAEVPGQLHLPVSHGEVERGFALLESLEPNRRQTGARGEAVFAHPPQALLDHPLVIVRSRRVVLVPGDADDMPEWAGGNIHRIERPGADEEFDRNPIASARAGLDRDRSLVSAWPSMRGSFRP